MVDYYGWINFGDETARDVVDACTARLHQHPGLMTLEAINGAYVLLIAGRPNHRGPEVDDVLAVFEATAQLVEGALGLLHLMDDEDPEMDATFIVYILERGRLDRRADPLLSPRD